MDGTLETFNNGFAGFEGGVVAFWIFESSVIDTKRNLVGADLRVSLEGFLPRLLEIRSPTHRSWGCCVMVNVASSFDSIVTTFTQRACCPMFWKGIASYISRLIILFHKYPSIVDHVLDFMLQGVTVIYGMSHHRRMVPIVVTVVI